MNKRYRLGEIEEAVSEMEELIDIEDDIAEIDDDFQIVVSGWSVYVESLNLTLGQGIACVWDAEEVDCQHFFRQIFLGYFSDIVQAFDTLRKNVCGDDYTSLHNPIVLSSVLPAYGMFHSIQILFL